jgi:hypothetical protein
MCTPIHCAAAVVLLLGTASILVVVLLQQPQVLRVVRGGWGGQDALGGRRACRHQQVDMAQFGMTASHEEKGRVRVGRG